jgi:hypothetical protein
MDLRITAFKEALDSFLIRFLHAFPIMPRFSNGLVRSWVNRDSGTIH